MNGLGGPARQWRLLSAPGPLRAVDGLRLQQRVHHSSRHSARDRRMPAHVGPIVDRRTMSCEHFAEQLFRPGRWWVSA